MIAVIDYGMSNLRSIRRGLEYAGAAVEVIDSPTALGRARALVLPGDGAFGQAVENLRAGGWTGPLTAALSSGVPFFGVCLGMQLLFDESEELGQHRGLGLLPGRVRRFARGKVPQIGWNRLHLCASPSRALAGVPEGSYVYFVNSFYCEPGDPTIVAATSDYYVDFAAVIERGNLWGAQFHPEKSQAAGLTLLRNFVRWAQ